ncbi:hypothetical protein FSARC_7848 [Fusarium sarcochroum]|uniref:Zn(2)-C6 fungal-type domain-containing protein n=1 Tax=Fusarium sarcochroum TaxID=1208366 RepID=A0A8H4TUK5_9HYPO|nr:hypothetical protein FSARC_7848 [Fusarium sarcochroum]
MTDAVPSSPSIRRPACIPCRSRKLACDRSRPSCKRCQKARSKLNCTYPSESPENVPDERSTSVPAVSTVPEDRPQTAPSGSGYFGYTSHNNVFHETQFHLFLAGGVDSHPGDAGNSKGSHRRVTLQELHSPIRESALFVLRCIPSHMLDQAVSIPPIDDCPKGWNHIALDGIVHSLQSILKGLSHRDDEGLSNLAEVLCNNTRKPIEDDQNNALEWINQFCGQNLRWESLGLLWAEIACISEDVYPVHRHRVGSLVEGVSPEITRACLGYCIELARTFTEGNAVLLDLCRRKSILDSIVDGDAHISSYVSHSLAITMLTHLGLHVLENGPSYQPSLSSEYQRRLAAQIFTSDKFGVSFAGRPPLLTSNFFSTPLPLDISDEDLVSDHSTLMQVCKSLDENGWNTKGEINSSTGIRARYMVNIIRDELMDLALCTREPAELSHVQSIKAREMMAVSSIAVGLRYNPNDLNDTNIDARTLYLRVQLQLDHLKNLFYAERLLLSQGQSDTSDLLLVSFELVKLTVEMWKRREFFASSVIIRNSEWLLLEYGAPAGGILCQGLLLPTCTGPGGQYAGLKRSAIVQQLSLLIAYLDWVRPSNPARQACVNFKHLIQRVLDYHLNEPAGLEGRGDLETLDWASLFPPSVHFDLLNSFDWLGSGSSDVMDQ